MAEIKCPNCGNVFQVEEEQYNAIASQVRDKEYEKSLKLIEEKLKADMDRMLTESKLASSEEITRLKALLDAKDQEHKNQLAITAGAKDVEIAALKERLQSASDEKNRSLELLKQSKAMELSQKDNEINLLNQRLQDVDNRMALRIKDSEDSYKDELNKKNLTIERLKGDLSFKETEKQLAVKSEIDKFMEIIKDKDEQIAYYKDFKAKLSTKGIGESLEQYCLQEFNKVRSTAYREAYFEKDNDASGGSKGDFIFRDSRDGQEFLSIMFEMKNEADETATKHKNEDFFDKLDKDRKSKGCEYAILVTTLEPDNEFYNMGIADVSYRYEKMYVVRPQFFLAIISILRDAALNSLEYRKQLAEIKEQNIDVSNFEEKLTEFKDKFSRNYRIASEKFEEAIKSIDKSIHDLEKTKAALISSQKNLGYANDKAEKLTIKKLIWNNPTMKAKFEDLKDK